MKLGTSTISYSEAYQFIKKFRYKPRKEWTHDERLFFKICNFIVLSKKRINKIFIAFDAFSKLSDKSHYNYKISDIKKIKDMIVENLQSSLKKFDKNIKILKESDIESLSEYFVELKMENTRLHKETERLQAIVEKYVKEKKLFEIQEIEEILNRSNEKKSHLTKNRSESLTEKSLKTFIQNWEKGLINFDIKDKKKSKGR